MIIPYDLIVALVMAIFLEPKGWLNYTMLSQSKIQCFERLGCVKWIEVHCKTWILSNYYIDAGYGVSANIANTVTESSHQTTQNPKADDNKISKNEGNIEVSIDN
jgi:hypothetical protein